jgi:YVTN family beta-propeller protein
MPALTARASIGSGLVERSTPPIVSLARGHPMDKQILRVGAFFVLVVGGCSSGPNRKAYVGLFGDKAIAVLDTATQKVLKTIPVTAPDGLVITPNGKKVYVSSTDSGVVDVISTTSDTVTSAIDVGAQPAGLSITPDGRQVIVSVGGANEAAVIDTTTDAVVSQTTVAKAHNAAVSPDGHRAYVASQVSTAPAIVVVDLTGAAQPQPYSIAKSPRALADAPWGKIYFSAQGDDSLEVMDPTGGQVGTPIATGGSPHDTRPTLDTKFELVVSQTAGDLEFVDPNAGAVVATVATGKMPHWIGLSSDGLSAYVTNEGDNNIVVVDLNAKAATQTIAVGNAPRKIAIQP